MERRYHQRRRAVCSVFFRALRAFGRASPPGFLQGSEGLCVRAVRSIGLFSLFTEGPGGGRHRADNRLTAVINVHMFDANSLISAALELGQCLDLEREGPLELCW